jgi:hypothetical protein
LDHVTIEDPPRMNLLGLILGSIIDRNLARPENNRRGQRLTGDLVVQAGQMTVTLAFGGGRVTVSRGPAESPRSAVAGSLDALMNLALGGGMVGPWLTGKLKTQGSLLFLLRVKPLLLA